MINDDKEFQRQGCYYKYRSLQNLDRFLSIIIDKRLYGALYNEMNDPMEGYYQYNPSINKTILDSIIQGKTITYICSLARSGDIGLMWSHYADSNRGCCLEVEVTSKTWEAIDVEYSENLPTLGDDTTIKDILGVKAKMWEYEQETRFIYSQKVSNKRRPQLAVKIRRIFIGCNVNKSDFNRIKKYVIALNPKIEVIKMNKRGLKYGFTY
jgi:hypothetical protein